MQEGESEWFPEIDILQVAEIPNIQQTIKNDRRYFISSPGPRQSCIPHEDTQDMTR